jgi:hypothetical protein
VYCVPILNQKFVCALAILTITTNEDGRSNMRSVRAIEHRLAQTRVRAGKAGNRMSGGSYDYVCWKIEEFATSLRNQPRDPRRASFAKLMMLVAKAAHDIEWVDSCDYGEGDEHKAIDAVFAFLGSDPDTIRKAHSYDQLKELFKNFLETQ